MLSRRSFLGSSGAVGLVAAGARAPGEALASPAQDALPSLDRPSGSPEVVAQDEAYWTRVASYYRISDRYTNLEAGYFGMMAAPVLAEYHRHIDRVNLESSHYVRRAFNADMGLVRERLARSLGAKPTEVALTRGATEALQRLIVQYRNVGPGDAVMYVDLDYGAMQYAMNALAQQRGANVVRVDLSQVPPTREGVLTAYADALDANPRVKLLLLTHLNNKTGLIIPVKEIAAMARERGADVVVDAAHSFGQCDLSLDDLGADFVGCNLHKWLGAPVGAGVMYIKEGRLGDVDRMLGDEGSEDRIDSRIHTGTANFATYLTVPAALDFHDAVGQAAKAARVRYLRDRWVSAVRGKPGINILVPDDRDLVAAITSFRLHGRTGREENQAVAANLLESYGIFTVWRSGVASGDCVRVTPALYNSPADADRLAAALIEMAARG